MTGPPRTPEAILASWTANATAWTETVRGGHIESRRAATDDAIVAVVRSFGAAARVLDVGCGEGWLCRALRDAGMAVTGIDGCAALARAAGESGGIDVHACTYDELIDRPLAFGPFDTAVCNFSLFERDLGPLLRALHELLTPGGTLVIQTVHPHCRVNGGRADAWRRETFGPPGERVFAPMPWYFRTVETWHRELAAAGFDGVGQADTRHPRTGDALSLILHARKVPHPPATSQQTSC